MNMAKKDVEKRSSAVKKNDQPKPVIFQKIKTQVEVIITLLFL